jgi:hypothetical protein
MCHYLILVLVFLFSGTFAFGQYSLGSGDGLDSSTSSQGRVNNQKSLPNSVRNNAIRSNNVLLGTNFNGSIGRSDDAAFRLIQDAAEADDGTYEDALYNSPWYWNNWNKQSTQFLKQGTSYFNPAFIDNWSTSPQQMSEGRSIRTYSHDWNNDEALEYSKGNNVSPQSNWSSRQLGQHRLGQVLGTGSQTEPYDTSSVPVGEVKSSTSIGYLTASPMSGVSMQTSNLPVDALGFSAWDAARVAEDEEAGIGFNALVKPWRTSENRLEYGVVENRVAVPDQYINILDVIEDRAVTIAQGDDIEETTIGLLDQQYADLQEELAGLAKEDYIDEERVGEGETPVLEEVYSSLRHGERVGTLSGIEQNRFNELVRKAEMAIAGGEYFRAEKLFNQSLKFIPGHPLATAGLGHSNIGSGLYLSASHVLQSLFIFQPEMISVLYEPQLLPPRIELVRAAVSIDGRLDNSRDGEMYSFLLAYIGYQLQDLEMIEKGISKLEEGENKNDQLVQMLKYIWLPAQPTSDDSTSQTE